MVSSSSWGEAPDAGNTCAGGRGEAQRTWGHVAPDITDPQPCILKCRDLFYQRLAPQYDGTSLAPVCEVLSGAPGGHESPLRELYCCDSLLCGVDTVDFTGQDPNVNSIINQCQSSELGIRTIQDPGHPPLGFICPLEAISRDENGFPCEGSSFIVQEIVPDPAVDPATVTALTVDTKSQPAVPSTSTTTSPSISSSSSANPAKSSRAAASVSDSPPGPSPGAAAAVAVCSTLASLLLVTVVLCCLRRRARSRHYRSPPASLRRRIEHPVYLPGSSPTPLMSPSAMEAGHQQVPLSPPPRLRERRLLCSVAGSASDKTISVPGTPTAPPRAYGGFPPSQPGPPMGGRMGSDRKGHELLPAGQDVVPGGITSVSSLDSRRTTTTSDCSATAFSLRPPSPRVSSPASPGAVLQSPHRPPRPHDSPLEIPDLVRPDRLANHTLAPGPPPNRALPPAPVASPPNPSPSFQSAMRHPWHEGIGIAIGTDLRTLAPGGVHTQEPPLESIEGSGRCQGTDGDSWGSWGRCGPGITLPSPAKREREAGRADSFIMDEAGLERLGGRC